MQTRYVKMEEDAEIYMEQKRCAITLFVLLVLRNVGISLRRFFGPKVFCFKSSSFMEASRSFFLGAAFFSWRAAVSCRLVTDCHLVRVKRMLSHGFIE